MTRCDQKTVRLSHAASKHVTIKLNVDIRVPFMKEQSMKLSAAVIATVLLFCGPVAGKSNLILNGDVEDGSAENGDEAPTGWRFGSWTDADGNPSHGEWDSSQAFTGTRSLKITGRNGGWYTSVDVDPESISRLSFRYRQPGGNARVVAYVRIDQPSSDDEKRKLLLYTRKPTIGPDTQSGFVDGQFIQGADENGWVQHTAGNFRVPSGVRKVSVLVKLTSDTAGAVMHLDDFRVEAVPSKPLPVTSRLLAKAAGAVIWTENENRKVLPQSKPPAGNPPDAPAAVSLDLARGEYGVFQIVVTPSKTIKNGRWNYGKPKRVNGGKSNVTLYDRAIEYVNVKDPLKPYGLAGPNPDPLAPYTPGNLKTGENHSFWFTVFVPHTEPAGIKTAELKLISDRDEVCQIPVKIRVRDFAIPKRPSLDVYARMHASDVKRVERGSDRDVIHRYYRGYFQHRVRCSLDARLGIKLKDDAATVNADELVEHLKFVKREFGARPFFIPLMWISHDKHRMPVDAKWKGRQIFTDATFTKLTPRFEKPFADSLQQVTKRLREEGLFEDPIMRFIDEPNMSDEPTLAGIRTLANLIKRVSPEISVSLTATAPDDSLIDTIDHWVLHTDAWDRNAAKIAAARKAGNKISVYNNGISYVEQERMRIRMWPWLLKKYDVDGTYSWCGTTAWRGVMADPWNGGNSYFTSMLYPPRPGRGASPPERGPIDSVRWELFRQGLQDYEYLVLAEQLADELERNGNSRFGAVGREAIEEAMKLVDRWPQVRPPNDRPYNRDASKVADIRRQLADAIESMQKLAK